MQEVRRRGKSTDNKTSERDNIKINENNVVNDNKEPTSKRNISLRIISRVVVIFSLLIVVYFSTKNDKLKTFAKQSELLHGKGLVVECSQSYKEEVDKYEGCVPKECKRFVTDKVISVREAEELLEIAKKGLKLGGSSGGASILDLHSGALSLGQHFVNIYKREDAKNVFTEVDFNIYRVVKEKIKYAVAHHFGVKPNKIYLTHPTFFSEITSKKAVTVHDEYWHPHVDKVVKEKIKYAVAHHFGVKPNKIYLTHPTFFSEITSKKAVTVHDEYWHPHVDKETYKSFHYTTLLYLGDYNIDFKGGRFVFVDEKFNRTVEPRKARLSMFTSGGENFHYVEKVTSGIRYAMTISFTCDKQYAIEDPSTKNI